MHIDYRLSGQWWDLNETLTKVLGLPAEKVQVRAFKGLHAALCEITQALSIQFPHKKKAYYFKSMDPSLEGAMMALSRMGVQVEALDLSLLDSTKSGGEKAEEQWAEALSPETLAVVFSEDDPLLGRLYPVDEFEAHLLKRKIYALRISHSAYRLRPWPEELMRPQLRVYSAHPELALGLTHGKLRFLTPLAEGQNWQLDLSALNLPQPSKESENRPLVENFEASSVAGAQALWPKGGALRLYDRALVYWTDMDGEAVIRLLAESMGHSLQPPGQDRLMETASLSRWGGVKTMDWLKEQGLAPEVIRGLVILDQSLLKDPTLGEKLASVRQRIVKLQNGD